MFASTTPRDLNQDPKLHSWFSDDGGVTWYEHEPRPEYDHPQYNRPNPILVDVRAHIGDASWTNMLKAFNWATSSGYPYVTKEWERIEDPRHIDHARRVLTRLAALEQS